MVPALYRHTRGSCNGIRMVSWAPSTSLRSRRLAFRARLHRRNRRLVMRIDPRHLDQEAALLERRSRTYVIITDLVLLLFAFGFIWLTW
jgi:hypothetical protein